VSAELTEDRKRWATAVSALVRHLMAAGYSGVALGDRIRAAKDKTTEEVEALAAVARSEAEEAQSP
jgi:hypothetical protein